MSELQIFSNPEFVKSIEHLKKLPEEYLTDHMEELRRRLGQGELLHLLLVGWGNHPPQQFLGHRWAAQH